MKIPVLIGGACLAAMVDDYPALVYLVGIVVGVVLMREEE